LEVLVTTQHSGKSRELRKGKQGNTGREKQCREIETREYPRAGRRKQVYKREE